MKREYHKWVSGHLKREMEFLVFGHAGRPVIFFPTRTARFYDYEDWNVIEAVQDNIERGEIQVYCIDSIDQESFYCKEVTPAERIQRHIQFEKYILFELLPFVKYKNNHPYIIAAGCSLGAYHALNIAFRHPLCFNKVLAMSGRYDLTLQMEYFDDLFDRFRNEDIYFHMPSQYIPLINDQNYVNQIRKLDITLVIGEEDIFLENNQQLHEILNRKNIPHQFFTWEGEAHKAKYWKEMLRIYL